MLHVWNISHIWFIYRVNVGKYSIHGAYGIGKLLQNVMTTFQKHQHLDGLNLCYFYWTPLTYCEDRMVVTKSKLGSFFGIDQVKMASWVL